jgi:hypothetical protein
MRRKPDLKREPTASWPTGSWQPLLLICSSYLVAYPAEQSIILMICFMITSIKLVEFLSPFFIPVMSFDNRRLDSSLWSALVGPTLPFDGLLYCLSKKSNKIFLFSRRSASCHCLAYPVSSFEFPWCRNTLGSPTCSHICNMT